jgi:tetratricopeptide (TPR) repeat protein
LSSRQALEELFRRGLADHQAGRLREAEAAYREILAVAPGHADTLHLLGIVAHQLGRNDAALDCIRRAIALDGAIPIYHGNLGAVLCDMGQSREAEGALRTALRLNPDLANVHSNLGNVLNQLGRCAEAAESARAALRLRPDDHGALNNLGLALRGLGRRAEAEASYRAALRLRPDFSEAHLNLAYVLLLTGRFEDGWREYEWRWGVKPLSAKARDFSAPLWGGEAIGDRTILLHGEQGLGDALQFCRYVPLVAPRARVVLEVSAPLVRLLARLPGVAAIVARGDALPAFDLHCPLLSLPRAFGTTLDTIPAAIPYLAADPAEVASWRERLARLPGLRVGLVWAGGEQATADSRRSIALAMMAPLAGIPNVSFVSLQKGRRAAQAADPPSGMMLHDFTEELRDFADTAALVEALDLVISVDTAVAHLAGALGKTVWLLNRFDTCWRWLLDRDDSPWYPQLRQFRQKAAGDWNGVIEEVAVALRRSAEGKGKPVPAAKRRAREALIETAVADHRAGRLAEAAAAYRRILAADPDHAEALHLLGVIAHQQGRNEEAVDLTGRAIAIDGTKASYHGNFGAILCELGRAAEAEASLREAIRRDPAFADAHANLGVALRALQRPEEAAAAYREALRLRPEQSKTHGDLGSVLLALNRHGEAAASFEAALRLAPEAAEFHHGLAVALRALGRPAEAAASYRAALRLRPDHVDAHNNLGNALVDLGRPAEAMECYRAALALQADFAEAHNGLGAALCALGRAEEAEASFRTAVRLRPEFADAHNGLGAALCALCRPLEAEAAFRAALRLRPDLPAAHKNLGYALLMGGRIEEGWREHEWRWQARPRSPHLRDFPVPRWTGEPLAGRTILLHAEQGFGDTLQFCRYAALVAEAGGRILLEVPRPLVRLLGTLPGVAQIVAYGEPLPDFDVHCPLLSLPYACRTTLETIPAGIPYLAADPAAVAAWRERLAAVRALRVGLVWAGGIRPSQPDMAPVDRRRSIALATMAPLAAVPGVSFVSLQKGEPAAEAAVPPPGMVLHDFTAELEDFADTAALVEALDLVISVDTAVAHLAGALGKPVWLLNRFDSCWRWLLDRDDSPWYPQLRQFRQPTPGDWASVLRGAAEALARLAAGDESELQPRRRQAPAPAASTEALFEAAFADHQAGRLGEAGAAYQRIIDAAPNHSDAWHLLGVVAHQLDRNDLAAEYIGRAVALSGDDPSYRSNLGGVLCALGRHAEAEEHLRRALRLRPDDPDAHNNLGIALRDLGRIEEAAASHREAVRLRPDFAIAHSNLGHALNLLGRPAEAEVSYRAALNLRPDVAEDHHGLGFALRALGRPAEAEACHRTALRLTPDFLDAHNNLGNALLDQGRTAEAEASFRAALDRHPDFPEAQNGLGIVHFASGRPAEAEPIFRAAVALRPDFADAHLNLGFALLAQGKMAEGWAEHEWRWKAKPLAQAARKFAAPQWQGEEIGERTILLHAEQGFGDTLQFCRYAPLVAAGARTVLEVQAPLVRLLSRLPGVAQAIARGEPLPAFDLHSPLLSLPKAFNTTLETIPADIPYLAADPVLAAHWRERLAPLEGLRVGLVWAGGQRASKPALAAVDRRRSIALAALAPLGGVRGVSFVSLQKGDPAAQAAHPPPGLVLHDWTDEIEDFADTAALIDGLDLVITVDTAVAHLAGAMGKPVWLLNRFDGCWRWLLDREDSPWYPQLRLFRQPVPGDWARVLGDAAAALQRLVAGERDELRPAGRLPPPRIVPEDLFQRGVAEQEAGRLVQAEAAYRGLLALEPRHAGALGNLGTVLRALGRPEEAAGCFREALALRPDLAEAHRGLAKTFCDLGRAAEAEESFRAALALRPDFADAHHGLGTVLSFLDRPAEAEQSFRQAVGLRPDLPEAWYGLGAAQSALDRPREAEASYGEALRLRPEFPDACHGLGLALLAQGRLEEAEACLRTTLRLRPNDTAAMGNLGFVLIELSRFAEAEAILRGALELKPDAADALATLGAAVSILGRPKEAEACFRTVLTLRRDHPEDHQNLGCALLLDGRFEGAWEECEWRWKTKAFAHRLRNFRVPQWTGEAIGDRTILLHAEQGYGDTLQFCRYVPLVAAGARTVLEAPAPLVRLLSGLPGIAQIVAHGERLPPFDLHCPLLSLPRAFQTTLATIPTNVPYLAADPDQAAQWRERLAGLRGLRVGLCWAGADFAAFGRRRSIALARLAPLGGVFGASYVSLQKDAPAGDPPPPGLVLHDFSGELDDFADTAALVEALDLVISVDTAVAHLAGAMGKPVWLLNRFDTEWRWMLGRDDSPWYPQMRQFRQPAPGDWDSVIGAVVDALRRVAIGDRSELLPRDRMAPQQASQVRSEPPASPLMAAAPEAQPATIDDALHRALADQQAGRRQEAEAAYRQILEVAPRHADALVNLGRVLRELDRPAEAEASLRKALEVRPNSADAHLALGMTLRALGRSSEAEASYREALRLNPDNPFAHYNLGVALHALDRSEQAEICFRNALRLRPDLAEAHNGLGVALSAMGRMAEAETSLRQAIALRPGFADACSNLGIALRALGRPEDAEASYREALRLRPDSADTHNNLGNTLLDMGRLEEAAASFREALRLRPDAPEPHRNLSAALLAAGRYEEGWKEHEWRWRVKPLSRHLRDLAAPPWMGEPLGRRVILLHAEQGFGDTLQFCRYVPLVAAQAETVLEVPAGLLRLLARLPGIAKIVAAGDPLPPFDLHCPLLSLPLAFGTTLETIPARIPYLAADPVLVAQWRKRLAALDGLRVGLVWAGEPRLQHPESAIVDRRRSIALETMAPLARVAGASFVSLQIGAGAAQAADPPAGMVLHDWTAEIRDFADTAAVVHGLDLVISVDTAVVHLAGALGKPVWLLNRFDTCWRWLFGRDDSPWYPQLRQFRQPTHGDWRSAIEAAGDALRRLAAGDRDQLLPRRRAAAAE